MNQVDSTTVKVMSSTTRNLARTGRFKDYVALKQVTNTGRTERSGYALPCSNNQLTMVRGWKPKAHQGKCGASPLHDRGKYSTTIKNTNRIDVPKEAKTAAWHLRRGRHSPGEDTSQPDLTLEESLYERGNKLALDAPGY